MEEEEEAVTVECREPGGLPVAHLWHGRPLSAFLHKLGGSFLQILYKKIDFRKRGQGSFCWEG